MPYDVVYGRGALDPLFNLKMPQVLDCVEQAMNRLADDPVQHGRRGSTMRQLPDGRTFRPQEFDFSCDAAPGQTVHFRAHFYYGDDEHTLHVISLIPSTYRRL
jgi:hypothetical protein